MFSNLAKRLGLRTDEGAHERAASVPGSDSNDLAIALVIRALPIGIVVLDDRRRVILTNPAAAAIFGFDEARVQNAHLLAAIQNVELERRVEEAFLGEASVATLVLVGNGGRRTYAASVAPLEDEAEQRIVGAVLIVDDRTEISKLERARADLLSNVSHELRTPLSSIRLMLETVIASPEEEAADLFLPQALAQVDRLVNLVEQLLDQARTESGLLRLQLCDIDLAAVAQPILSSFEPQAAAKDVEVRLIASRLVRVEADPDRLAQIFVNLIDNAIRHTPIRGTVTVELDVDGGQAILRVRDTGVGIPYRDLPHIFERFYVVDRSRARASGGAGLGLAIVKQIVDAHGGTITAESRLGKGTTFTVRLPMLHLQR